MLERFDDGQGASPALQGSYTQIAFSMPQNFSIDSELIAFHAA
jgi:hypothetical protein